MAATNTANGCRDTRHCVLKVDRYGEGLSASTEKRRTDCATKRGVLPPKLHLQGAPSPIKNDRTPEARSLAYASCLQRVPRD